MTDDELIVWVANAHPGRVIPARMTMVDVVKRLVPHGCPVIEGDVLDGVRISAWAREYLERTA